MATADEIGRKLRNLSKSAPVASEKSVRKGAQIVKVEALASAAAVTHGSLMLRGVKSKRGKGAKLGARYTVTGSGSSTEAVVRAVGPWGLIENKIEPHELGTQGQVMRFPDGGFATGPFKGGGSPGKKPWHIASARSRKKVEKLYDRELRDHIRRNF